MLAEFDKERALAPRLADELHRVAIARLQILVRIEPQPERTRTAPGVRAEGDVFVATKEHDGFHLLGKMEGVAKFPFALGEQYEAVVRQTGARLFAIARGRGVERLVAHSEISVEAAIEGCVQQQRFAKGGRTVARLHGGIRCAGGRTREAGSE